MKNRYTLLLAATACTHHLHAATLNFSTTQPTPSANGIHNWTGAAFDADNIGGSGTNANGSPNNGAANDATTYVAPDRPAQGQTFLTGSATQGYDLSSLTVRVTGYANNIASAGNNTFWNLSSTGTTIRVRVGKIDGSVFYPKAAEHATAGGPGNPGSTNNANGPGTYLTFTFDSPVRLEPDSEYGIDLSIGGGSGYFELLGIRDAAPGGNPFTAGTAYTSGSNSNGDFTTTPLAGDRVFLIEMTPATAPLPPLANPPRLLHTEADFDRMREKVAQGAQPWRGSWDLLVGGGNSSHLWGPRAVSVISRGGSGDNCALLYNDAAAAYQNALRWKITGDLGHADKAVQILNAWGYTLTEITGNADRFLAAGLYGYQMAVAADIMRSYPGWAAADFEQFKTMMVNVFYPKNNEFLLYHNGAHIQNYWANWDLCNMASILAIGILCEDQAKIDQAVDYFKTGAGNGSINNAVPILHSPTLGQWQEAGRDQQHTLMGIGLMATFCEMAWNQGINLYGYNNSRFMAGAEYVARYNNMKGVPFAYYSWRSGTGGSPHTQTAISTDQGITRSVWDTVVGHYSHRLGIHIPEVEEIAATTRPDGGPRYGYHGSAFDHLGFTSLTHYRGPVATSVPAGVYQITARHSGSALTVLNNGTTNGTNIEQRAIADPNIANSQNWSVTPIGSGQYRVIGGFSGRALDVSGISTANGANMHLWEIWGGNNQKFTFSPTDSGFFRLTPVHSGKCVAVGGASTVDGANVLQWQYHGGQEQQWTFTAASTVRRLRSYNFPDRFVRHYGYRARIDIHPFPAQDSAFRVVHGLANSQGVSFESINNPDRHLRVRADGTVWVDADDGTPGFNESATFRRVAGLADSTKFSYQMWADSSRHLRHGGFVMFVDALPAGAEADATFEEVFPAPGY